MTSKTPQRTLLEQAKSGEVAAIASLMNQTLAKQKSQIQIRKKNGHYKLLVVAAAVPPQKRTVDWLFKGLKRLGVQDLEKATIYGKAHKSAQPDWQQCISFVAKSASESAPTVPVMPVDASVSHPDAQQKAVSDEPPTAPAVESSLDLSEYCFTRNKSLLKGELTYPAESVAQLVLSFAMLSDAHKQAALPYVEQALRKPVPIEDEISIEAKDWLAKIAELEGPQIRKASI